MVISIPLQLAVSGIRDRGLEFTRVALDCEIQFDIVWELIACHNLGDPRVSIQ